MGSERDCILAIANGEVIAAGPIGDASTWFARDPEVTEIVRMPPEAAGLFLFEPWPGRDAALALLERVAPDTIRPAMVEQHAE